MGEIVNAVNQVSTLIAEINASSHKQNSGLEKLNGTVTEGAPTCRPESRRGAARRGRQGAAGAV